MKDKTWEKKKLSKITDTLEVKLATALEDAGYAIHEDMDGKDFAFMFKFIRELLAEKEKEVKERIKAIINKRIDPIHHIIDHKRTVEDLFKLLEEL